MVRASKDRWVEWLAERRFGGDPETRRRFQSELIARRDKVLELAGLNEGQTLLDVGCGEGLIGFGALDRGAGTVIFSDISADLLDSCRSVAAEVGVLDRCRFVQASADALPLGSASVDVVTTRSVLIYVADKAAAFREFARVLRPGGRISLFEPINRFALLGAADAWAGFDLRPLGSLGERLRAVYAAIQPPDSDLMLDFDERDLINLVETAGFYPIKLHLDVELTPTTPRTWDGFLHSSGNPRIPTLQEALEQEFVPEERERITTYLRPLVESGGGVWRMATAHLSATKPQPVDR